MLIRAKSICCRSTSWSAPQATIRASAPSRMLSWGRWNRPSASGSAFVRRRGGEGESGALEQRGHLADPQHTEIDCAVDEPQRQYDRGPIVDRCRLAHFLEV